MLKNIEKIAFWLYEIAWQSVIPMLRRNPRLAEGFDQRTLRHGLPGQADIWIQAASAGESYLAGTLLKFMKPPAQIRVLLTSNTRQGVEILEQAVHDMDNRDAEARVAYFPFDSPVLMNKAVKNIRPRVMIFLELEIWPGLLSALKKHGCKTLIINGRIRPASLRKYLLWPSLWRSLRPEDTLAISHDDAERFASLFGRDGVAVMRNMKFDRIGDTLPHSDNPLRKFLPPDSPFVVLGSTRYEEEPLIEKIILYIRGRHPGAVIGLFPRHMHRTDHWKAALDRVGVPRVLRSELGPSHQGSLNGTVILWDTFGELSLAYEMAKAVFVGGSLAPLGGQNFLEPLICGVIPVIGPSWENFAWVGREIAEQGLLNIADDCKAVADILAENIEKSLRHEDVREATLRYVKARQGGTEQAWELVLKHLVN
ncbi:glycosyltransferase N-terminal domain-containing protein [Desulfococcaceae bacterium HSG8]|nr:glycosyltransferase N-terminal domain-containing protein [Desulfococcaceae bacterium HSG8]